MSVHICDFRLQELFAWTVFFKSDYDTDYKSLVILSVFASTMGYFSTVMTICLSYSLCIDLILMLRFPLRQKESRLMTYYIISVVIASIVTILSLFDKKHIIACYILRGFIWGLFDSFFLMVPISICYARKKLSQPGLSREVK